MRIIGPLLNTGFHFNVDSWPGNVGSVFNQHMVLQPTAEKSGNDTKYNPVCSYVLTSAALETSGDSEVSRLYKFSLKIDFENLICLLHCARLHGCAGFILVADALVPAQYRLHLPNHGEAGADRPRVLSNVSRFAFSYR